MTMSWEQNLVILLIGAVIGVTTALIGGFIEYRSSLRSQTSTPPRRLPGCLLYVAGGLALAGIIALVISFIFSGGILPALIMGAGVLGGFYGGFACLFLMWIFVER